jgi:hypothetical protein
VYIGTDKFADAFEPLTNVINAGYSLHTDYDELFMADNNSNGAQNEVIFAVAFDSLKTQTLVVLPSWYTLYRRKHEPC